MGLAMRLAMGLPMRLIRLRVRLHDRPRLGMGIQLHLKHAFLAALVHQGLPRAHALLLLLLLLLKDILLPHLKHALARTRTRPSIVPARTLAPRVVVVVGILEGGALRLDKPKVAKGQVRGAIAEALDLAAVSAVGRKDLVAAHVPVAACLAAGPLAAVRASQWASPSGKECVCLGQLT
jgi:hypothetical protein